MSDDFGTWLRTVRKERKMKQSKLAEISKCSLQSIKSYETGLRLPSLYTANMIADALGYELVFEIKDH